jgi:uncharacterized protein YuzE
VRWTYDAEVAALYIYLVDGRQPSAQVEMPDGTVVDVDDTGRALGIEVVRSWAEWDIQAVITRFGLDAKTADEVLWIANSTIVRRRPPTAQQSPAGTATVPEMPTQSSMRDYEPAV